MMANMKNIEEGKELLIDFDKLQKIAAYGIPVVPAVVQNSENKEVLFIGYANKEALDYTLKEGIATFWSTSRNELWIKGATSGDELKIVEVRVNCEQNSLLYVVKLVKKGCCHTKGSDGKTRPGCYYRRIENGKLVFGNLSEASDSLG